MANFFKESGNQFLVTGAGGFIGFSLVKRLLERGENVIAIDNIKNHLDDSLNIARISFLKEYVKKISKSSLKFYDFSISDKEKLEEIAVHHKIDILINLAAQAGVRFSVENPYAFVDSNLVGFLNILEFCRKNNVKNFVYASSSSVYGNNLKIPFHENDSVDHPISFYAATKRSNELMAHSYSSLYNIPSTGLRFFTVYGPWGRPDMAPMIFVKSILENRPIKIFNNGDMFRDFTYIDDIVDGIIGCSYKPATSNKFFNSNSSEVSTSFAPHRIFNIGNSKSVGLIDFINKLEDNLEKKAIKEFLPMQMGDVKCTFADVNKLYDWIGYEPKTNIDVGIEKFIFWYKNYYK